MSGNRFIPPREGLITVLSLSGTTASAATAVGGVGKFFFICNRDFYPIFGGAGVAEPDETATSGNQRCALWPAGFPLEVDITGINDSYIRVKPTGDSHLRWWKG